MLLLTALVLALAATPADKPAPVPVYVTSAGALHGFTDPDKDNADTVRDLKKAIKWHKALVVTEDPARAVLVLTVIGREESGGSGVARTTVIRATLRYAEQETPMTASLGAWSTWSDLAEKLASQLKRWVTDNRAALTPAAQSPAGSPPR
jgi:hypothetical protein